MSLQNYKNTFNDMAARIEQEIALRKSEEDRRRLILDISHDLKTLVKHTGICRTAFVKIRVAELNAIYNNSQRANNLLNELFELSKWTARIILLSPVKRTYVRLCVVYAETLFHSWKMRILSMTLKSPKKAFTLCWMLTISAVSFKILRITPYAVIPEQLYPSARGRKTVVIDFSDDGVGIPEHLAQDIFKPFVRVDDSRNSETGGSGLGLSIAKKIAQLHGGDLALLQAGKKGSAFRITIPMI